MSQPSNHISRTNKYLFSTSLLHWCESRTLVQRSPKPADLNIYKQVWICEKLPLCTDGRKFQGNDSGSIQTTRRCERSPRSTYREASSTYGCVSDSPGLKVSWNRSSFLRRLLNLFCSVDRVWAGGCWLTPACLSKYILGGIWSYKPYENRFGFTSSRL